MTSLITINTSKNLCYNLKNPVCNPNTEIKVISVIGKARTGKSTFMNILISYLKGLDTKIFEMSDTIEHCTNGVDYYYLEDQNVLLLDFQGIYLGDSSVDCKLLLFAYLLSDMIIFNEKEMLSNMTLQQFEPMLLFIHYIDKDSLKKIKNPQLIFRISDIHLKLNPIENRNNMLNHQTDQFQSIRDCISEQFDDLTVLTTYCLERSERKLLCDNKFIELLKSKENGFEIAVDDLIENITCLQAARSFGQFTSDVNKITQLINNQEKIDYTKLDVTTNLAKVDIHDFINNIDKSIYNDITVDGTQKLYDENIEPIINKKDNIIKDINKMFISKPKQIVDNETKKYFIDKIMPIIEKAQQSNESLSYDKLQKILIGQFNLSTVKKQNKAEKTYNLTYNFGMELFEYVSYNNFIKPLEQIFKCVEKESKNLLKSTYDKFIKSKDNIINKIKEDFENKKNIIKTQQIDVCKQKCNDYFESLKNNFEKNILDTFDIDLNDDIDIYYTSFIDIVDGEINKIIENKEYDYNKINKLTITFNLDKFIDNQDIITEISKINCGDKKINKYFQSLLDNTKNDIIHKYIKYRKDDIYNLISNEREKILYEMKGKIAIDKDGCPLKKISIIEHNSQIKFVKFILEEVNEYLMIEDYYADTLAKDLENICKNCENEGYVNDWNKFIKKITDIKIIKDTTVYVIDFGVYKDMIDNYRGKIMMELFELEFKKYFARNKFIFKF